ncbi:hypothetical protein BSKO_12543 [Bryopsis sp. KO-2023]|nr:hypothetical protein BSKO_12543 [Bryopsis sp. KO-2023]
MLNLLTIGGVIAAVLLSALAPAVSVSECDFFRVEGGYLESVGGDLKCSSYPSLQAAKRECLSTPACDGFSFGPWGTGVGGCQKRNRDGGVTCNQKFVGYHKTIMGCCRKDKLEKGECHERWIERTEKLVSRGKPTTQSSVYKDKTVPEGGLPSKAVDGNKNIKWAGRSCSHTLHGERNPWWSVDLLDTYDVFRVAVIGEEGSPHETSNLVISVGDNPFAGSNPACVINGAVPTNKSKSFPCALRGRFVTITLVSPSAALSMAEVEVFAMVEAVKERKIVESNMV